MIHHGMKIVRDITHYLSEKTQIPVLCMDQPLYALAKQVQWSQQNVYGEDKFVALLGDLHIEQAFMRVIGQFMTGSGWVGVIANSGITTAGRAEAMLKAGHITRARAIHQVTAACLHYMLIETYNGDHPDEDISLEDWITDKSKQCPIFLYWITVLNLEILLLCFVRAIRTKNFMLYKEAIKYMLPWFFLYDHQNYSRWLTVHLKTLEELVENAPEVHNQFMNGNFVVSKTSRRFSAIGIDQAHEQHNAFVKASGGAVGLLQDASALRRFTIGGPEVIRLLSEFCADTEKHEFSKHHEQYEAFQESFRDKCVALRESFAEFEIPFQQKCSELFALDSREVAGRDGVETLQRAEAAAAELYKAFITERFIDQSKSLYDKISRCKTKIFTSNSKAVVKTGDKLLRSEIHLFSRYFIVSVARRLDLDTFFMHENQSCPPSLSLNGRMRSGNKSDLVSILEAMSTVTPTQPLHCDGVAIDGAALVHALEPKQTTFNEYYDHQVKPHLLSMVSRHSASRIDLVWDMYHENSLKSATRESRGRGVRRHNLPTKGKLPTDWRDYLRNEHNKEELFLFLGNKVLDGLPGFHAVTNVGGVIRDVGEGTTSLRGVPCGALEEADARLFLHLADMVRQGAKSVLLVCSDTDILVEAVRNSVQLRSDGLSELWVLFGSGTKKRYIAAHGIAAALGDERSLALPGFHCYSGCDINSFFAGITKKKAMGAWTACPEATEAFKLIAQPHMSFPEQVTPILERVTVLMYDKKSQYSTVNEVRKDLFATKDKLLYMIPPTSAALLQHAKRASYAAGQILGRATSTATLDVPSPEGWGWKRGRDGQWEPLWATLPSIWDACRALSVCGCGTQCETNRCRCRKNILDCTPACKKCKGNCSNKSTNGPQDPADEDEDEDERRAS